ncbi:ABC transporter ATP-binding protein [Ruegeria arenilitoris]|uniref:ABC transporter ATP-binding protein n=1 Tax=Ruegeria arenilitoris TaxID=1173585 RepID=UPI00147B5777|nr:ABC transporter ATP-binding protein [Ruegeria arenilitoris]
MSIAHLLEDFTAQADSANLRLLDEEALEEERLAAFERGYGAGWEDALQAQAQDRAALTEDMRAAFSDMSFTYQEALTRMTLSLEPMFSALVQTVLPQALDRGLAARVIEQLSEMANAQVAQPILLLVPPGVEGDVEALLPVDVTPLPKVVADPELLPGQARLQVGTARSEVDCTALLDAIAAAFDAYVFEAKEALSNE